jgi:hypothetical protein
VAACSSSQRAAERKRRQSEALEEEGRPDRSSDNTVWETCWRVWSWKVFLPEQAYYVAGTVRRETPAGRGTNHVGQPMLMM